ncbi:hypothetical protein [Flexivirga sp.]|uniref:hypothetical protein n=1 Tax=Flexivirga sp. TaxID=1962927 RepID=UPI003F7DC772
MYADRRRSNSSHGPIGDVSVAHLALAANLPDSVFGTDAEDAFSVPVDQALHRRLAFDHAQILEDGVERALSNPEYSAPRSQRVSSTRSSR